jgi:ribonuclease D
MSFHGQRRIAQNRWGKATVRPQDVYPDFLARRVRLNKFDGQFATTHPLQSVIERWQLTDSVIGFEMERDIIKVKWIDSEKALESTRDELKVEQLIAVDAEFNNEDSFLGMICVLQLSTKVCDYVIDCLKLHNYIYTYLGPIFRDPTITKLVFSGNDLPLLQRDFQMFSAGVIDIQEVYAQFDPSERNISLQRMVEKLFGVQTDKLGQFADWHHRPLHGELLAYAAKDAYYLLLSWSMLVSLVGDKLKRFDFSRSREESLKLYRFPKTLSVQSSWENVNKKLHPDIKTIFNNHHNFELFEMLHEWRNRLAKDMDYNIRNLISDPELGLIGRARPKQESNLLLLHPQSSKWPPAYRQELHDLILRHQTTEWNPIPLPIDKKVEKPEKRSKSIQQISFVNRIVQLMEDDEEILQIDISDNEFMSDEGDSDSISRIPGPFSPANITNHAAESIVSPAEEVMEVEAVPQTDRREGTSERMLKRQKLRENRRLRNEERIANGEEPIVYRKNRGPSYRIKKQERRRQFLLAKNM